MTTWNTNMDEAPRDGTRLLVLVAGEVDIASWDDDRYAKRPRPFWFRRGAWGRNDMRTITPTAWMPLPPPPDGAEGE